MPYDNRPPDYGDLFASAGSAAAIKQTPKQWWEEPEPTDGLSSRERVLKETDAPYDRARGCVDALERLANECKVRIRRFRVLKVRNGEMNVAHFEAALVDGRVARSSCSFTDTELAQAKTRFHERTVNLKSHRDFGRLK